MREIFVNTRLLIDGQQFGTWTSEFLIGAGGGLSRTTVSYDEGVRGGSATDGATRGRPHGASTPVGRHHAAPHAVPHGQRRHAVPSEHEHHARPHDEHEHHARHGKAVPLPPRRPDTPLPPPRPAESVPPPITTKAPLEMGPQVEARHELSPSQQGALNVRNQSAQPLVGFQDRHGRQIEGAPGSGGGRGVFSGQPGKQPAVSTPPPSTAPAPVTPTNMQSAAKAIRTIETGSAAGDYSKIGPRSRTGDYPHGAYQVMGANIGPWTEKHLGKRLSSDEFLGNKEAQDKVFEGEFGGYAKKYGPYGAARAWLGGEKNMDKTDAKDVLGTSVGQYGSKFAKLYDKFNSDQTAPGGARFSVVDNAKRHGIENVDKRLVDILNNSSNDLPPGYRMELYSGYRPGDKRFHGRGMASDIRIIDPQGHMLPNYQQGSTFRNYEKVAQSAKKYQTEKYPELDRKFRWGGYFGGPKGRYGATDTMHFDFGGTAMAGGSFEHGLTERQKSLIGGGVESSGMGDIQKWQRPTPTAAPVAPVPLEKRTFLQSK